MIRDPDILSMQEKKCPESYQIIQVRDLGDIIWQNDFKNDPPRKTS